MNFYFAPPNVVIDCESSILSAIRSVLPSASVHCCRFHLGQAWWRHMNSIGLGLIHKDRSSDVAHWLQLFLDYHFFHRTKLQMLLLMTSCQMHRRLILRWSLLITYWRTIGYCCGFEFSANLVGAAAGLVNAPPYNDAESYHSHRNAEFYAKHPNIYTCLSTYWRRFNSQHMYPWTVVTTGTHIKVWKWEETVYCYCIYFDYRRQVVTRKEFLKKVCYRYGPRTDLWNNPLF